MKRHSAVTPIRDKPTCHPLSHYRPIRFTENNKHFISGSVFVCAACMKDKGEVTEKVDIITFTNPMKESTDGNHT